MRTLVSCQPPSKSFFSGFTLIEVLVVLVIVGLLAGVALPKLFLISQRYAIAAERETILTKLGNLGYGAYANGITVELATIGKGQSDRPALSIPNGWRIEVPIPIRYEFNGVCSGGSVTLISPDGTREDFRLAAPICKPMAAAGAP